MRAVSLSASCKLRVNRSFSGRSPEDFDVSKKYVLPSQISKIICVSIFAGLIPRHRTSQVKKFSLQVTDLLEIWRSQLLRQLLFLFCIELFVI